MWNFLQHKNRYGARSNVNTFFPQEVKYYGKGNKHCVVVVDCGVKHNMIRNLVKVEWVIVFFQSFLGLVLFWGVNNHNLCIVCSPYQF